MKRLVSRFTQGPGTVAVVVAIVTAMVMRVGLIAGWPKPILLLLALGIELPLLLWMGSWFIAERRQRRRD